MRLVAMGVPTAVVSTLLVLLLPHLPAIAATSPPPAFCDVDGRIIPGARIGQVTLNQPAEDARSLLDAGGAPPQIHGPRVDYRSGPNAEIMYFAPSGFVQVVWLYVSPDRPPAPLHCRTPEGVGIDSLEKEVLAAYGPAPRVSREERDDRSGVIWHMLIYDDRGIAFWMVTRQSGVHVRSVLVFSPGTFCTFLPRLCSP